MKRKTFYGMLDLLNQRIDTAFERLENDNSDENAALVHTAMATYWQFVNRHFWRIT